MEESEDEDLPAFDVVSSSAVGERDVNRVLQVFPDIGLSKDEIRRHIRKSGSTEATINHILDNQLERFSEKLFPEEISEIDVTPPTQARGSVQSGNWNVDDDRSLLKSCTLHTCDEQQSDSDSSVCVLEELPLARRLKVCTSTNNHPFATLNHRKETVESDSLLSHSRGNYCLNDEDSSNNAIIVTDSLSQCSTTFSQSTSSDWSHTGDSQESDRSDSMKGSRQKLLEAERERRNQERLAKKLAKEREKLELKRAKEDLKKQAKLVKVKEKAEKQAKKAAQKASSKAERIKHVTAVVDKLIANEESVGLEIMATLNELEIKVEVVSSNVPWSVTWQRAIFKQELLHDYSEVLVPTRFVEENEVVVLWPASEFVNMVEASCHQQMSSVYHSQSTAKECVKQLVTSMSPKRCTIVIYGLEKYYRRMKTKVNREYRSAVLEATNDVATSQPKKKTKKSAEGSTVTHVNVEEVLAELSVYVPCQIHKYESGHEIGQYLARMTKAVADAPYDRRKNQTALSAILCDVGKGTVKVFEDGSGFGTLWKQQLMQFPSVSAQVAHAIASVYTSVRSLREAYKNCGSIREAQNLLQDIMVQRGVGILASNRRVGPELSRKIHAVFTSQHPDTKLQHSVEECQEK